MRSMRIQGFRRYLVTDDGRVFNTETRMLMRTRVNYRGYEHLDLRMDGERHNCFVHRLVAAAFIPNPFEFPIVNHKDGDKRNNRVSNLEWVDGSENNNHYYRSKKMMEAANEAF